MYFQVIFNGCSLITEVGLSQLSITCPNLATVHGVASGVTHIPKLLPSNIQCNLEGSPLISFQKDEGKSERCIMFYKLCAGGLVSLEKYNYG